MSDYLVHFSKDHASQSAYSAMLSILGSGVIRASHPFGIARGDAPNSASQNAVCLSEIPLHLLDRLAAKRSEYGIVFRKDLVLHAGGNPILYAYKDQAVAKAIRQLMDEAGSDASKPIWRLTPFVDVPGVYPGGPYFYEWEREWRVLGDFHFSTNDVSFLIIPEDAHEDARGFFDDALKDNTGPSYDCPFIDAHWSLEKIEPLVSKPASDA